MKELRRIQKTACMAGLCYGLWLGGRVGASNWDARNAFVIIVLVVVILISLLSVQGKETKA